MTPSHLVAIAALLLAAQAAAQSTSNATIVVAANGEVVHANDFATATFAIEERDSDKALAASRVNQKMKEGLALLRAADPQAQLKTQGYYTQAVYPEQPRPVSGPPPKLPVIGWRVGQYLQLKTANLAALPKTTAAAQAVLGLNGIQFSLAPATLKQLDAARIAAAYASLQGRIAAIAAAMGRSGADAVLELVDFEGSGNYGTTYSRAESMSVSVTGSNVAGAVSEPSFEPGETTLQMKVVGKLHFK